MAKGQYSAQQEIKLLVGLTGKEVLSDRTVVHRASDARDAALDGECRNTAACALCAVSGVTCELVNQLASLPHDGLAQIGVKVEKINGNSPGFVR
jgi:hypothetical protein